MRSWPIALAFFASSTALAAYDQSSLYNLDNAVSIEGQIEVNLYQPHPGSTATAVEITLADGSTHLLDIQLGQKGMTVTPQFAAKAGLKIKEVKTKGTKTKIKVAVFDTFSIGDSVTFSNVPVEIKALSNADAGPILNQFPQSGISRSGSIGLASFPQLAGALNRTEGILRLAPAEQGESMLASISGANQVAYTSTEPGIFAFDKKTKRFTAGAPILVEGTYGAVDATVALGTKEASVVSPAVSEKMDAVLSLGAIRYTSDVFSIGGAMEGNQIAKVYGALRMYDASADLYLGSHATADWDIAWSPNNRALAIRPAEGYTVAEYYDVFQTELDESLKKSEDATDSDASEDKETDNKAHAPTYAKLAHLAWLQGNHKQALDYMKQATDADSENCSYALGHGIIQLTHGDFEAAKASFDKADALYSPWGDLELEKRKELQKKPQDDQPKPQPSSCFQAVGLAALSGKLDGNLDAIAELDIGNEKMSILPALAAGNAYLASGDSEKAVAAFLQLNRLEVKDAWAGLGLAQKMAGKFDQASSNLLKAILRDGHRLELVRAYADTVAKATSSDDAVKAMKELSEQHPKNATFLLVYAEALQAAGKDATTTLGAAESRFQWLLTYVRSSEVMGQFAQAKIARGDMASAQAIANKAVESGAFSPSALDALAKVQLHNGNIDEAKALIRRAGATGDSAYAALLAQDFQPVETNELEDGDEGTGN